MGCDRLADIARAISRYPLPLITIDLGTATTFNVLDENRRFLGGLILPGVGTAHRALLGRTAQLPKGDIHMPAHTIGANTQECITGGMLLGNACAIDGLIRRIQTELGKKQRSLPPEGTQRPSFHIVKRRSISIRIFL